jgi:hypothetical protein
MILWFSSGLDYLALGSDGESIGSGGQIFKELK